MKLERAEDILRSHGVVDVDYKGQSVWIRSVDKANALVEIGIVNNAEGRIVSPEDLHEARAEF
ncbi:MAG: small, acid-soluble spore protein, H family [Vallitaleaceae bacterium]|nr:small, acid-soluble spore protein, H family [Vallitaleaceae bacterium]